MTELPHTRNCFVCGSQNPIGFRQRFHSDGRLVTAAWTPLPEHIGFSGVVHGGITSTLLDEIMVWACAIGSGQFAYCAELTVRFLKPIAPGLALTASAELIENKRNRILIATSALTNSAGERHATATGKYIPLPPDLAAKMAVDFEGDPQALFRLLAKKPPATP